MGISGIIRIEEFEIVPANFEAFDPMLSQKYKELNQDIFTVNVKPEPILEISDIAAYNTKEGLALSAEEVEYLNNLSKKLGRTLTDSEIFALSQANSEHCRHKIFNGTFVVGAENLTIQGMGENNAGALRSLSGTNTFGGTVTLANHSRIQVDAGAMTLSNASAIVGGGKDLTINGLGTLTVTGSTIGVNVLTKLGASTLTMGSTSAGKSTFLMRLPPEISTPADSVSADENQVQGSRPANMKSAYGWMPSVRFAKRFVKTKL